MKFDLKKNKKEDELFGILFLSIMFSDLAVISKLLHPKGRYMGMSKSKFIYSIQRFNLIREGNIEEELDLDFGNMISLQKYPGQRCFELPMNHINGGKFGGYVFKLHPDDNQKIGLIVKTGRYISEETFVKSNLMYSEKGHEDFDFLFRN